MKKNNNFSNMSKISIKILLLILLIIIFSIIYFNFDDKNFGGISNIQEVIKEELLKNKIKNKIKEKFYNSDDEEIIQVSKKEEKAIDDTTKKIKNVVKDDELDVQKIKPSLYQQFFNRIYFSVITGTTLGYGDIYPVSNLSKFICGVQGLFTVALIIY